MSLFTIVADFLGCRHELKRIADVLERMAPLPDTTEVEALKPEEAVTYVDEEEMAKQELREQLSAVEKIKIEHPEWFEPELGNEHENEGDTLTSHV